jgi:hypothetical protein
MNKILFSILLAFGFTFIASAQQAYEGTIQYDKKKQRAVMIDYPYPAQAVENAVIQKMEKLGYRAKEEKGILNRDKGFLIFKNAYVTDISDDKMDYLVKVERKSRKESDEAVLYMIMMKEDANALDKLEAYDIDRSKTFLNNMIPDIEAANLELQIKAQEEAIAKAEKKLRNLKDDQSSLEKKLQENKTDQNNTEKDIDNQKQALINLVNKRKPSF